MDRRFTILNVAKQFDRAWRQIGREVCWTDATQGSCCGKFRNDALRDYSHEPPFTESGLTYRDRLAEVVSGPLAELQKEATVVVLRMGNPWDVASDV